MKILLVAATKFEIAPLLRKKNILRKNSIDVLITGVGMTQTAYALGKIFAKKKYDLAINAGVAGSFKRNISLGSVVNVTEDYFADFGAEDGNKFLTAKEINLVSSIKYQVSGNVIVQLKKVKGITVNTVHGNNSSIKKVRKKFNPDIESMEGAVFFYACQKEKIPCVQLRAISNYVERRNKKKWKIDLAIKNLNFFLEKILK